MENEKRYAILIGIDDYSVRAKLDYAVKDAKAIRDLLVNRCLFSDENISLIISEEKEHISDVTGRLLSAFSEIKKSFVPENDSLFFYFAGHGEMHFGESTMIFHDSSFPIKQLCDMLNSLKPKFLSCIIDACESGGKVLTRGVPVENKNESVIQKYLEISSGVLFMFACQEDEKAHEMKKLGHGLFTYYFLQAFEQQSEYDEFGILVPEKVIAFVKKNTIDVSKFKQCPVVELHSPGYYPLAFTEAAIKSKEVKKNAAADAVLHSKSDKTSITAQFPKIDPKVRHQTFQIIKDSISVAFLAYGSQFPQSESYSMSYTHDFESLPDEVFTKAKEEIVSRARNAKVPAAGELFSVTREPINNNMLGFNWLDTILHQNNPTHETRYWIEFGSESVFCCSFSIESNDIEIPSGGFGFIFYQALYGIGLASFNYHFEWNGYEDAKLSPISVSFSAFKIQDGIREKAEKAVQEIFKTFDYGQQTMKDKRIREIEDFNRIAK